MCENIRRNKAQPFKWDQIKERWVNGPRQPSGLSQYLDQGWPHFFYGGQKNGLKKLGGHKNVSQKAWGAKFRLKKTNYRAWLNF